MPVRHSKQVSEKIIVEMTFPDQNKLAVSLQVKQNSLTGDAKIEYVDIRLTSFNKASTTEEQIKQHWVLIEKNLPMIKAKVSSPTIPHFLQETKKRRRSSRFEKCAFLNPKKARNPYSL